VKLFVFSTVVLLFQSMQHHVHRNHQHSRQNDGMLDNNGTDEDHCRSNHHHRPNNNLNRDDYNHHHGMNNNNNNYNKTQSSYDKFDSNRYNHNINRNVMSNNEREREDNLIDAFESSSSYRVCDHEKDEIWEFEHDLKYHNPRWIRIKRGKDCCSPTSESNDHNNLCRKIINNGILHTSNNNNNQNDNCGANYNNIHKDNHFHPNGGSKKNNNSFQYRNNRDNKSSNNCYRDRLNLHYKSSDESSSLLGKQQEDESNRNHVKRGRDMDNDNHRTNTDGNNKKKRNTTNESLNPSLNINKNIKKYDKHRVKPSIFNYFDDDDDDDYQLQNNNQSSNDQRKTKRIAPLTTPPPDISTSTNTGTIINSHNKVNNPKNFLPTTTSVHRNTNLDDKIIDNTSNDITNKNGQSSNNGVNSSSNTININYYYSKRNEIEQQFQQKAPSKKKPSQLNSSLQTLFKQEYQSNHHISPKLYKALDDPFTPVKPHHQSQMFVPLRVHSASSQEEEGHIRETKRQKLKRKFGTGLYSDSKTVLEDIYDVGDNGVRKKPFYKNDDKWSHDMAPDDPKIPHGFMSIVKDCLNTNCDLPIELIESLPYQDEREVLMNLVKISKKKPQATDEDTGDLLCLDPHSDAITIDLRCPITLERIQDTPVKGLRCQHARCYSLESFLKVQSNINNRRKQWLCPMCDEVVKPLDLYRDGLVKMLLSRAGKEIETVQVREGLDGTPEFNSSKPTLED